jgi:hypothetical protein
VDSDDDATLSKHECLERAKRLLASGDPAALRYACLELRFCLEAVTYEKLRAYSSRLPAGMMTRWQPPQAVSRLLELEGDAGEEYTITVGIRSGEETGPLEVIGEYRTFTSAWLRKHYNKLGSFLHVPNASSPAVTGQPMAPEGLREYLKEVLKEFERVMDSEITSTFAPIVEFTCELCQRKISANAESARRRGRVVCLDVACAAEHIVWAGQDGSLYCRVSGSIFPCQRCEQKAFIPAKVQVEGYEFTCGKCGRRHKLVDRVWRYSAEIGEGDGTGSSVAQ